MVKKITPEVPPPGAGLATVMFAVASVAIIAARTVTVQVASSGGLAAVQVVGSGRAAPFQKTVDCPLMNPVPRTVSVKSEPPGATAVGETSDIKGTGLDAAQTDRGMAMVRSKPKPSEKDLGKSRAEREPAPTRSLEGSHPGTMINLGTRILRNL